MIVKRWSELGRGTQFDVNRAFSNNNMAVGFINGRTFALVRVRPIDDESTYHERMLSELMGCISTYIQSTGNSELAKRASKIAYTTAVIGDTNVAFIDIELVFEIMDDIGVFDRDEEIVPLVYIPMYNTFKFYETYLYAKALAERERCRQQSSVA